MYQLCAKSFRGCCHFNLFTKLEAVLTISLHVRKFENYPTHVISSPQPHKWGATELVPELDKARVGDTVLAY